MQKLFASLIMSAAILAGAGVASAQSAVAPNGVWVGYYGYGDRADTVQMQVKFTARGSSFTGFSIEPNTFGDEGVLFLTANIQGVTDADGADFTKTYDGTGGQSHSIEYTGAFTQGGRCLEGKWRIAATVGPFKICADSRLVS
jgi:hypothetical protein